MDKLLCLFAGNNFLSEASEKNFSPFTFHYSQDNPPLPPPLKSEGKKQVLSLFKGRLGWVFILRSPSSVHKSALLAIRSLGKGGRKAAFTLAEVLITLGIIGVVAAITMPVLVSNHKDKVAVTQLKKAAAVLGNAYSRAYLEYGDPTSWGLKNTSDTASDSDFESSKAMYDAMGQYIKTAKDCGRDSGCFKSGYYLKTNNTTWNDSIDSGRHRYKIITPDGMSLAFHGYYANCDGTHGDVQDWCGAIYVDIDGPSKGRGMLGDDLFAFMLTKRGIIPSGPQIAGQDIFRTSCLAEGFNCAGWVLTNENRDYLKCNDLSWDEKTSCK